MIGRLVGVVINEEPTGALVLDVQGVGYELSCPVGTGARAQSTTSKLGDSACRYDSPDEIRKEIVVYVHTNLRQDSLELYGFCALREREAFRQLITVPNVGPRLAIAVLNVLPADELASCIDQEDKTRIVRVPGVGKKTAERLILELRGKLSPPLGSDSAPGPTAGVAPAAHLGEQLAAALTGLGYKKAEAEKAAKVLLEKDGQQRDLSLLLRAALDYLAP